MYRSNGWMVYQMLFAKKRRLCATTVPHLLATDHYFTADHAVTVLRNCSAAPAESICTIASGWKVTAVYSDCSEFEFKKDHVYLPGNDGAVIELKNQKHKKTKGCQK